MLSTTGSGVLSWATASGCDTKWVQSGAVLYTTSTATSVGINTSTNTPSSSLHVVGTFQVSATTTLDQLTASRALVTNASKNLVSSAVTGTELGYLSGVTSAVQTQLDAKQTSDATLTAFAAQHKRYFDPDLSRHLHWQNYHRHLHRISSNGSGVSGNPTIIDSGYVGQTSITTLGTITSGTWNGSVLGVTYVQAL